MKNKIAILGSTGTIGKCLISILKKNRKTYSIELLSAHTNIKSLLIQAKYFNVKNLIITDVSAYKKTINNKKYKKYKIYNNFDSLDKIFKNSNIDYTMSSISGIGGLRPTLKIIKYTKTIAIANKESLICGWELIKKRINKFKTTFIPVDSEHFSIWFGLKNYYISDVKKIYLTASGGPLLKVPRKNLINISINKVLKHPNWNMGKKISVDSATMMNKVFETIEANKIFNIPYKKIDILIHPKSYLHAIIQFNNGMTKIILHDTTMEIPIFNSLNHNKTINYKKNNLINLDVLNDLKLNKISSKKFPMIKILKQIPAQSTLFDTLIVLTNDYLVNSFLNKKITYLDISKIFFKIINLNDSQKFKKINLQNLQDIYKIDDYVRLKISSLGI